MSGKTPAAPQQERPEKSQEDRLMDELFGEPVKKEGKQQNPYFGKDREIPSVRAYLREARQNRRGYF